MSELFAVFGVEFSVSALLPVVILLVVLSVVALTWVSGFFSCETKVVRTRQSVSRNNVYRH